MESLLSDKDSQIALLEVFGAKSQQQVERLDILRSDRSRLNQRLKVEVFLGWEHYVNTINITIL